MDLQLRATNKNVVWSPLPGSQTLVSCCPCNHILYHGTRGPGKTDVQIMFFRRFVGLGYGQYWRGVIFDREYKNLDDLISKSKKWFFKFNDGAKFLSSNSALKWVWPTGEELWFRTMANMDDYWKYHGQEFPYIGWNELTKYPNSDCYDAAMSLNRSSFVPELHSPIDSNTGEIKQLPELPLVTFATTNPFGVGHNWVKLKFIDEAKPGQVVKKRMKVYNPRTGEKDYLVTKTQVHIFGSYKENRYLSPEYVMELESIKDENKRRAWAKGDWDITSGGMFDDVWSTYHNVVPDFPIPPTWRIFRSFDWGSSKPFSVGWWAESTGGTVQLRNGKVLHTLQGDLFRINEWYGWTGVANTGVKLTNRKIAQGIVERELKLGIYDMCKAGPADSSIYDDVNETSIATDMQLPVFIEGKKYRGVTFIKADKSPGSRRNGWERLRTAILNAQPDEVSQRREYPGLFVFQNCKDGFLRTLPNIPRDTVNLDDVDTNAEDHVADEVRYVILSYGSRFNNLTTRGLI